MDISRVTAISEVDYSGLREMMRNAGWNVDQVEGQIMSIMYFVTDAHAVVFFARDGERLVAFLTCQFSAWNRLGQIHGLVVDPAYRRQNLASQLVERGEQFLRQKGSRGVYVDTPVDNAGGRRFYEAAGYQVGYIMPQYYAKGQDGVTYQKFFAVDGD